MLSLLFSFNIADINNLVLLLSSTANILSLEILEISSQLNFSRQYTLSEPFCFLRQSDTE
jgi:hypothetical protein